VESSEGPQQASLPSQVVEASEESIARAADILRAQGLVAFPTETVYGLGADACSGTAVARIFASKGRPSFNPLIIHVPDPEAAEEFVRFDLRARAAARAFWPGPLTLILPRRENCPISDLAGVGLPTLAVRVPAHPVALALLKACGIPLAAPSANRSGTLSPTAPIHVVESLGDAVDLILAAGACAVGVESTVLDLSGDTAVIARPGAITATDLEPVLGCSVTYDSGNAERPVSPGQLLRHYAPSIPVRLNAVDVCPGEALLAFGSTRFMGIRGGTGAAGDLPEAMRRNLSQTGDLHEAAANLFAMLRALDRPEHNGIAVMAVPEMGLGIAINDRLRRAAHGSNPLV
jgi:L-threonylcarbamoyladenylate synthase